MYLKLRHYCYRSEFFKPTNVKDVQSRGQNESLSRQKSMQQIDVIAHLTAYLNLKK